MENKKDNDISFSAQDSKNTVIFKLFEKDNYLIFIYKKTERIAAALYLLSNLLSDSEPIKWQFRTIGTDIINQALSLMPVAGSVAGFSNKLGFFLLRLLSLLDVSYVAGSISEMNFMLLKREVEQLLETLNTRNNNEQGSFSKGNTLDKNFFAVPKEQLIHSAHPGESFSSATPSFPGNENNYRSDISSSAHEGQKELKNYKRHNKGHNYIKDTNSRHEMHMGGESGKNVLYAAGRQTSIIEMLKTKNNLTIKDFALVIKGWSSKTIQRELLKLVKSGVLKKQGERRWSRYSLVSM